MLQSSSQQDFHHSTGLLGNSIAKIINYKSAQIITAVRFEANHDLGRGQSLPDPVESKSQQMQFAYQI